MQTAECGFGHPPRLLSADRGVHSADTEVKALAAGVNLVALPAVGKVSVLRQALEQSWLWRRAYRWRSGIEGRIASLRREYGLHISSYHELEGMERWIGLGVLASNLRHVAQAQVTRATKKRVA